MGLPVLAIVCIVVGMVVFVMGRRRKSKEMSVYEEIVNKMPERAIKAKFYERVFWIEAFLPVWILLAILIGAVTKNELVGWILFILVWCFPIWHAVYAYRDGVFIRPSRYRGIHFAKGKYARSETALTAIVLGMFLVFLVGMRVVGRISIK